MADTQQPEKEQIFRLTNTDGDRSEDVKAKFKQNKDNIMILVTGATEQLGTAAVQNLQEKTSANQVAASVRDESKASAWKEKEINIRVGNYDDTDGFTQQSYAGH